VKIAQRWDGFRPPINYLLRDYRIWLVDEKINEKKQFQIYRNQHSSTGCYRSSNTIPWIEKLLQMPIADYRKYVIWRIVLPYLFNIKKLSETEVIDTTQAWLKKCNLLKSLDFSPVYLIKQNIKNSRKHKYLPISFSKLCSENQGLYDIISTKWKH
jgi:Primase X